MQTRQGNLLESLRGIQAFLDAHEDALGTIPESGTRQQLDAQVAQLNVQAISQAVSHRAAMDATRTEQALRQIVLRNHMAPIACIAAAILPRELGLAVFKLPRRGIGTQLLHIAAMGMANVAEPHAALFAEAGLPVDFVTQLRNAADSLLEQSGARARSRSVRRGATASLAQHSSNVRLTVRALDALVRHQLRASPDLLAQWSEVRRLSAKPSKSTTPASRLELVK